jgi:cold shock CspA family protein
VSAELFPQLAEIVSGLLTVDPSARLSAHEANESLLKLRVLEAQAAASQLKAEIAPLKARVTRAETLASAIESAASAQRAAAAREQRRESASVVAKDREIEILKANILQMRKQSEAISCEKDHLLKESEQLRAEMKLTALEIAKEHREEVKDLLLQQNELREALDAKRAPERSLQLESELEPEPEPEPILEPEPEPELEPEPEPGPVGELCCSDGHHMVQNWLDDRSCDMCRSDGTAWDCASGCTYSLCDSCGSMQPHAVRRFAPPRPIQQTLRGAFRLCEHFDQLGVCLNGNECGNAHGRAELEQWGKYAVDLRSTVTLYGRITAWNERGGPSDKGFGIIKQLPSPKLGWPSWSLQLLSPDDEPDCDQQITVYAAETTELLREVMSQVTPQGTNPQGGSQLVNQLVSFQIGTHYKKKGRRKVGGPQQCAVNVRRSERVAGLQAEEPDQIAAYLQQLDLCQPGLSSFLDSVGDDDDPPIPTVVPGRANRIASAASMRDDPDCSNEALFLMQKGLHKPAGTGWRDKAPVDTEDWWEQKTDGLSRYGTIESWHDRGFGFIADEASEKQIFVHHSSLSSELANEELLVSEPAIRVRFRLAADTRTGRRDSWCAKQCTEDTAGQPLGTDGPPSKAKCADNDDDDYDEYYDKWPTSEEDEEDDPFSDLVSWSPGEDFPEEFPTAPAGGGDWGAAAPDATRDW